LSVYISKYRALVLLADCGVTEVFNVYQFYGSHLYFIKSFDITHCITVPHSTSIPYYKLDLIKDLYNNKYVICDSKKIVFSDV